MQQKEVLSMSGRSAEQELEELTHLYYMDVLRFCSANLDYGADRGLADDCTQEAFIIMLEKLRNGESIRDPKAFLYRTALNFVRRVKRTFARRSRKERIIEELEEECERHQAMVRLMEDDLDRNLCEEEYLDQVLEQLSDSEMKLLKAFYEDHQTVRELAQKYDISISAVTSRIHRLRAKIVKQVYKTLENTSV
jgi:RNA polymerase sigma-70 factor (ECF subfamily)